MYNILAILALRDILIQEGKAEGLKAALLADSSPEVTPEPKSPPLRDPRQVVFIGDGSGDVELFYKLGKL